MIRADDDQKKAFVGMQLSEQLGTLFDMLRYVRGEVSDIRKNEIGFREDLNDFRDELREVRKQREAREEKRDGDIQTTTEKIVAILGKRFDFWVYFRERVLPNVLIVIVLGLLYLVFGGKP